jgi:hypothetical protein
VGRRCSHRTPPRVRRHRGPSTSAIGDGTDAGAGAPAWRRSRDTQPKEIKIEVADDVLTVSASHEESAEEKDDFFRRERRHGAFSRSISLPEGVTADDIEATCSDGVLEVTFPKPKEQERKPVTITPRAG